MLSALQLCGASLDDYLHLLVPPIVKVFHTTSNPIEVRRYSSITNIEPVVCVSTCRTALETIEKLTATLDFTDFSSQIIHAIVEVCSNYDSPQQLSLSATTVIVFATIIIALIAQVVDNCLELRPAAMETLCCLMTQLNQRYKIFIPMVKKVIGCGIVWGA